VLPLLAAVVVGCGGDSGGAAKIALLLPDNLIPHYESIDRPVFEKKVEELCGGCEVLYENAEGDSAKQLKQADAVFRQGAETLVLDPVDVNFDAPIAAKAKAKGVPVLDYDQLIPASEPDALVSFDDVEVGELQAEALTRKLKEEGSARGPIVMLVGEPGDRYQHLFVEGARRVFDAGGVEIARKYDTSFYEVEEARDNMRQAIAALGKNGFAGVYAENDRLAEGAIAAMRSAGIDPAERPTTGREATPAGVRRILAGQQYMTVYTSAGLEATTSAEIAVSLAHGDGVPQSKITDEIDNGDTSVPAAMLEAVTVTKGNVKSTVVADGFLAPSKLCAGPYESACKAVGISGG
jgi:D-xylose transport system substrate-binding protein